MMMKARPGLGVAMVLGAAALWGSTGTAQSLAGGGLSSGWFGALRLAVAALFFLLYAWATLPRNRGQEGSASQLPLAPVLAAGLCMAVYNLAFFAGVRQAGIALGTAVALGSGPLWAGMLQAVATRQRLSAAWWLGTGVAVSGGVLMTLAGGTGAAPASVWGIALCLVSGLSYAVYTLINKELVHAAPAASVTLRVFGLAALLALPAAWCDSGSLPVPSARDLWAVLYVGVVTAGVAYLLFTHALRHISAATGVTLALGEPVVAFMLAIVVVGEQPAPITFGGLLLVIAGVLVVVRVELRATAADRADTQPRRSNLRGIQGS